MWPPPCVAVSPWSWKLRLKRCDHLWSTYPSVSTIQKMSSLLPASIQQQHYPSDLHGAWNANELLLYAFEWTTLFHWKFCRLSPYTLPYLNIYLSQAVTFSTNPNDYMFRIRGSPTKLANLHFCQWVFLYWRQSDRSKPPGPSPGPRQTPWSVPKALVARHSTTSITRCLGAQCWRWEELVAVSFGFLLPNFVNICSSNWIMFYRVLLKTNWNYRWSFSRQIFRSSLNHWKTVLRTIMKTSRCHANTMTAKFKFKPSSQPRITGLPGSHTPTRSVAETKLPGWALALTCWQWKMYTSRKLTAIERTTIWRCISY